MPRVARTAHAEFAQQAEEFLAAAQADGLPVHIGTSKSSWVHVGYLVKTTRRPDGRAVLVNTGNGEEFTPRLAEISLAATIDGRCISRASRAANDDGRHRDVSTALSGLASLLAQPGLTVAERARLEGLVGEVATLCA